MAYDTKQNIFYLDLFLFYIFHSDLDVRLVVPVAQLKVYLDACKTSELLQNRGARLNQLGIFLVGIHINPCKLNGLWRYLRLLVV